MNPTEPTPPVAPQQNNEIEIKPTIKTTGILANLRHNPKKFVLLIVLLLVLTLGFGLWVRKVQSDRAHARAIAWENVQFQRGEKAVSDEVSSILAVTGKPSNMARNDYCEKISNPNEFATDDMSCSTGQVMYFGVADEKDAKLFTQKILDRSSSGLKLKNTTDPTGAILPLNMFNGTFDTQRSELICGVSYYYSSGSSDVFHAGYPTMGVSEQDPGVLVDVSCYKPTVTIAHFATLK